MLEIVNVLPGGPAAALGLERGDYIVSVNKQEIHDVIDFKFFTADENVAIAVKKKSGIIYEKTVHKLPDDDLGLGFAPLRIKRCRNKCIFCFVDQMPKGCRESLYVKDDDFRASFLYGNYITLRSLSEQDRERIFKQRLSPLYISVHTTDAALRAFMLGNKKAPDIMTELKRLAAAGIKMHTQIVLCPEINDGPRLMRTIHDLAGLFPAVSSIAVVPVGLTAHRKGLYKIRPFTSKQARKVVESIGQIAAQYKKKFGTRLVFASDEFYIKAGKTIPAASFYEDFPQIENGVGMVSDFIRDASRARLPSEIAPVKATVVTSVSFSRMLKKILDTCKNVKGASISMVTVKNRFFGPLVTVAGLLTGSDIVYALKGKRFGDMLMIPSSALKEDEDVFLDNMSLEDLGRTLKVKAFRVENFKQMLGLLRGERGCA